MRKPRIAVDSDASSIVALRDRLAREMQQLGIAQWIPGEVTRDEVRAQIADREWFVVADDDGPAGAIRLIWSDPIWDDLVGPDDVAAGYVHGLMIDPRRRGQNRGGELLHWAEQQMRDQGVRTARLDCVASNAALRAYYRARDYREVGVRDLDNGWYPLMRFERSL